MKIFVDFYEKTQGPCPYCRKMKAILDKWIRKNPDDEVIVEYASAEENAKELLEYGVQGAPVIFVRRGVTGKQHMVSGNNPDILVDLLDGNSNLWDL